jgi:hypothetical protein
MVLAPPRQLLCTHAGDVRGFEEELAALLAGLDPDAVALCDVTDLVASFAQVERLAAAAQTLLAGRLEEAATWKRAGHRSVEEQLAGIAGTTVSSARNALKTSKRLRKLPATTRAFGPGSYRPRRPKRSRMPRRSRRIRKRSCWRRRRPIRWRR